MADVAKYHPIDGGSLFSDLRSVISMVKTRRTVVFAYLCMFALLLFSVFLAFNPSPSSSSPWFSTTTDRSRFSSVFSYFFPINSSDHQHPVPSALAGSAQPLTPILENTENSVVLKLNQTNPVASDLKNQPSVTKNDTKIAAPFSPAVENQTSSNGTVDQVTSSTPPEKSDNTNSTVKQEDDSSSSSTQSVNTNSSVNQVQASILPAQSKTHESVAAISNSSASAPLKKQSNGGDSSVESLMNCDLFDGDWIMDDSYPLYKPSSCSLIDEQFSCISNGRPDKDYLKYKWKPNGCTIPRLDANRLLEMLKGKRLVFVGDSLNRNMWESMVCILRSVVKDKSRVFEAHGRHHFRGEAEYSFVFKDYNFTVEFYVSPFLVQEWEIKDKDGAAKERLRLDLIGKTCDDYKGADILIFNTGHWWTHEKTSLGKDYYQEGSHVYAKLNVLEAFHKALTTWARWVDANVDPEKSIVFFRGYSASHFSGGQWNSGGACDSETEPIKNHTYLTPYPPKMNVLEDVLNGMKTHVSYLNITRLTDYRKDGHPSIYRKKNIPEAERKSPMRYQDCSHWCLPGVPDIWNELLFAELLVREQQKKQHKSRERP